MLLHLKAPGTFFGKLSPLGLILLMEIKELQKKIICAVLDMGEYELIQLENFISVAPKHEPLCEFGKQSLKTTVSGTAKEVISYLNEKLGSSYRPGTKSTVTKIKARLNEGMTVDDFKRVIDFKVMDWSSNPDLMAYLRPETLFGTKMESYLQQANISAKMVNSGKDTIAEKVTNLAEEIKREREKNESIQGNFKF